MSIAPIVSYHITRNFKRQRVCPPHKQVRSVASLNTHSSSAPSKFVFALLATFRYKILTNLFIYVLYIVTPHYRLIVIQVY